MSLTFRASIPPLQSAITVDGSGGGARIKLDVPECDIASIAGLMALRGVALKVTVQVDNAVKPSKTWP